jgi:hypothetical protein
MGLNGQTLLRVQRNGLKTPIIYRNWSLLAGHSVKPPKAKPKVQRKKKHPIVFPAQNNPLQSNGQDLISFFNIFMKKNRRPLDHSLGFHSCPTQTLLQVSITLVKKYCHVGILDSDDLWILTSNVKGLEARFLLSCNLVGGYRQPLDLRP